MLVDPERRLSSVENTLGALLEQSRLLVEQSRLMSPADLGNYRSDIRIFMINSQLRQAREPIVIVGDSITEAAFLPSTICGHSVVNAGIGGLTSSSYLGLIKSQGLLSDMKASLTIIALGTNNAQKLASIEEFESSYKDLLTVLKQHSSSIVLAGIPPLEDGALTPYFDLAKAEQINRAIQLIAGEEHLAFAPFAREETPTTDGVHLTAEGYKLWRGTVISAIQKSLNCRQSITAN